MIIFIIALALSFAVAAGIKFSSLAYAAKIDAELRRMEADRVKKLAAAIAGRLPAAPQETDERVAALGLLKVDPDEHARRAYRDFDRTRHNAAQQIDFSVR